MVQDVNPWLALPQEPPYILRGDKAALESRGDSPNRLGLDLGLLPVPWNGSLKSAAVVFLSLNPGVRGDSSEELMNADYRTAILANLRFGNDPPFFNLQTRFSNTGGYAYWYRRLKDLIARFSVEHVSRHTMCIEYFPYRSVNYRRPWCQIPSQHRSWALAKQAVEEGKLIVVQRAWNEWIGAVPALSNYPCIRLYSPRNGALSVGNMPPDDWDRLVRAFEHPGARTPSAPTVASVGPVVLPQELRATQALGVRHVGAGTGLSQRGTRGPAGTYTNVFKAPHVHNAGDMCPVCKRRRIPTKSWGCCQQCWNANIDTFGGKAGRLSARATADVSGDYSRWKVPTPW